MGIEMNTAIIIAAGVGHRTGQHVHKNFIYVFDKPIIIYILDNFQNSKKIFFDDFFVVFVFCLFIISA